MAGRVELIDPPVHTDKMAHFFFCCCCNLLQQSSIRIQLPRGQEMKKSCREREETMISADALLSCSLSFPALHSTQFFKRTTDTQPPPLLQSASSSNRGRPRNHTHTQKRTVLLPRRPIPACNQPKSAVCVHIETGKRWAHSPKKEKKRKRCYIRTERKREYHKI